MIQRRTPLKRTRVKAKRSKPRRGPMRDREYRRWLTSERCVIASKALTSTNCDGIFGMSDPAHTTNNGMRSKGPDSSCAPLCRKHHREYDAGRETFEAKYGVDMRKLAADHYAEYLRNFKS